jgi:hypothetical protein
MGLPGGAGGLHVDAQAFYLRRPEMQAGRAGMVVGMVFDEISGMFQELEVSAWVGLEPCW